MKLTLKESKTSIVHITDGFTFLGVNFHGRNRYVDNERFQKAVSRIHKLSKDKSGFAKFVKDTNTYLYALKNYYLKIVERNSNQHLLLQNALLETVAHKIAHAKDSKTVTTKKEFRIFLDQIEWHTLFDLELIEDKKSLC